MMKDNDKIQTWKMTKEKRTMSKASGSRIFFTLVEPTVVIAYSEI